MVANYVRNTSVAKSTIGVLGQMSIPSQPVFSYEEYERRWNKVRSSMAESNIDALITFNVENIFYLTGMDSENFFDYQCVILPIVDGEPKLIILDFESTRAEIQVLPRISTPMEPSMTI